MIITILGSCANQTALREGTALLVEDPEEPTCVLVDAGPGIVAALGRCGRKAADVSTVLLTHTHGDHISGFAYFVWQRYYECLGTSQPAGDLRVLGLENAIELAQYMLSKCYGEVPLPFKVEYQVIPAATQMPAVQVGRLRLTACTTKHTTPSIGCRFELAEKRITISSDTLPVDAFTALSEGADIMFHEGMWTEQHRALADRAMHATAKDAALVASQAGVRQLVLLHIYPVLLGREGELLREAAAHYNGPISIPFDGSVYIA